MQQPHPKIHAYLAHQGIASRRKAEELVSTGKVLVNHLPAQVGQRIDPKKDVVTVEGKELKNSSASAKAPVLYLIYKPVGVISTTSDDLHRTSVIDFLKKNLSAAENKKLPRVYPVGRLDLESEGLMILTNDGEMTHHFTHPSFEVEKTYQVTVTGRPSMKALQHLERGVLLKEGMTSPARVEVVDETERSTVLEITIHEGRHQQVRRMMSRVGYDVEKLVRIKLGQYTLDDLAGATVKKIG